MTRVIAIVLAVLSAVALFLSVSIDPRTVVSPQLNTGQNLPPTIVPSESKAILSSLFSAATTAIAPLNVTPVPAPLSAATPVVKNVVTASSAPNPTNTGQSIALRPVKALPVITDSTVNIKLIPDSELVNGPSAVGFNTRNYLASRPGYINKYTEKVRDRVLTGSQIVERVSRQFSVNPRLLIALIEYESNWIDDPTPTKDELNLPLKVNEANRFGKLYWQLTFAASKLNEGYYGTRLGTRMFVESQSKKEYANVANGLNAGTAAVQNYLAYAHPKATWGQVMSNDSKGFLATYRRLFGDPFQYDKGTPIPNGVKQPMLVLPWAQGQSWHFTGGPHESWTDGSPWGALDFTPPSITGCQPAPEWVLAASEGYVDYSNDGEVVVSLDDSQDARVGWSLLYMHMATTGRVKEDTKIQVGDRIGHPSCEGGQAIAAHLHFARKYNGEWVSVVGIIPFVLDGWVIYEGNSEFDGTIEKVGVKKYAEETRKLELNGVP